jgi:hypothetical protein
MRYRRASRNNVKGIFIVKVLNDEEYMTDIEQLKKKLAKIENDFYSSNLKLERIEKRRNSKIILSKVVNMFSSNKKEIKL